MELKRVDDTMDAERRHVRVSLGCHVIGFSNPAADQTHTKTLLCGVKKRVAADPLPRNKKALNQFRNFVRRWLKANMPTNLERMEFEDWLEHTNYSHSRKDELRRVKLRTQQPGHKIDTRVKLFVKDEPYDKYKHARGIYARCDEFKVIFGPWVKPVETEMYRIPSFIKHVPVSDRGDYILRKLDRDGGVFLATDYTAFESHFDTEFNSVCDALLFRHVFSGSRHKKQLRWCLKVLNGSNRIESKYVSLRIKAKRMSGEMNTSLSNGFANYMMFLYVTRNCKYSDCVVEGDDCLGVVSGEFPSEKDYNELGFRIKLEKHLDITTASFCGMIFERDSRQLVREPLKTLLNFGWTNVRYTHCKQKNLLGLAKSKAMSIVCETPHCPIVGAFAQRMLTLLSNVKYKLDDSTPYWNNIWKLREFENCGFAPTLKTRVLFHQLYGFTVDEQLLIEKQIAAMDYGPIAIPDLWVRFSGVSFSYNNIYVRPLETHKLVQLGAQFMTKNKRNIKRTKTTKRQQNRMNANVGQIGKQMASNQPNRTTNLPKTRTGFKDLASLGSLLGASVGSAYGPGGAALGGALGGIGGGLIGKIFGRGDYDVKFNTLVRASPVPEFPNANCIRFKHREYVQDISGSVGFVNTAFPINPGLSTSYPLLSAISSCFQQYCIVGQIYEFVSTSANALNSTNTALGTVIMATDYDSLDISFPSKQAMMATMFSNAGKPSESMLHAIECSPNATPVNLLYTRSGAVPTGGDQRLYDLGQFQIATQGMQAVANIGELWVTYDIILCKPVLSTITSSPLTDAYYSAHAFSSTWLSNMVLNPGPNQIGTTVSGNVITFPSDVVLGNYIVLLTAYGSNTYTAPTITPVGATILTYLNGSTNNSLFTSTSTANYAALVFVNVTAANATLTFTGTVPTLIVPADLLILKASSVF